MISDEPSERSVAPRKFLIQLLICTAVVIAANAAIAALARSSVPRQRLHSIETAGRATDLFLGNSLIDAGVDAPAFDSVWKGRAAINLGLGATGPVEHYLMLLASSRLRPQIIYYGFVDTELTDSVPGDFSSLSGNRAMVYYVYPDTALRYYAANDTKLRFQLRLGAHLPMIVDRAAVWARVERIRRRIESVGVPEEGTNRFGRAKDFADMEMLDAQSFRRNTTKAVIEQRALNPATAALLRHARQIGARVVCVAMPMRESHREKFYGAPEWKPYFGYASALLEKEGAELVDASDWVADTDFADPVHLAPSGARDFSLKLASVMQERLRGEKLQ